MLHLTTNPIGVWALSKREIHRTARHVRRAYLNDVASANPHPQGFDAWFALYKAIRLVYEAMYSDEGERQTALKLIEEEFQKANPQDPEMVKRLKNELTQEVHQQFPLALTTHEAWISWVFDQLLNEDEKILFINEWYC